MDKGKRASIMEDMSADVLPGQPGNYRPSTTELPALSSLAKQPEVDGKLQGNLPAGVVNTAFEGDADVDIATGPTNDVSAAKAAKSTNSVVDEVSERQKEKSKVVTRSIIKNVIAIAVAFTFLFTAYNAMANLQSTINKELGMNSLATLYGALVVSCALLPTLIINKLGLKLSIAVCMLGYSCYIAAQFYPQYYTLIPGAILLGLGAAPMWSAKCTYLTEVGRTYAELTHQRTEVIVTRMFGVFFLFFQSTQIWGNLISSLVLSVNSTTPELDDPVLDTCGIKYCAFEDHPSSSETDELSDSKLYMLSGIYLGCALLASVIILVFVDPISRYGDYENKKQTEGFKEGLKLIGATARHLMHPYQLLIIPLTIWSGVEQAFIQGDFTLAYISCGLGVHMIGYIMICYGLFDAICSITFSPMVKIVGRVPVFLLGASANIAAIVILMTWMPNPDDLAMFFIITALWGIADAVWQTQINALYGYIFPGEAEAAFSNYRMWESIGFIITFVTNSMICINTKLYIVIGFLFFGMLGFFCIEILERKKALPRGANGMPLKITEWKWK